MNSSTTQQPARRLPNAEIYRHISTSSIIELFDQGLSHRKIAKIKQMGPCSVGARLRREGKARTPARLSRKELRAARLDPAWEARRRIFDRIACRECGRLVAEINANGEHSHLRTHSMTRDEYVKKYPGARFSSFSRSGSQAERQGRHTSIQTLMTDFAAQYLTSKELIECRKDYDWEKRRGFDFVACRKCGMKIRTELHAHLKRHGYKGAGEYRIKYPRAPLVAEHHKASFRRPYAKKCYAIRKIRLAELARAERIVGALKNRKKPEGTTDTEVIGSAVEASIPVFRWLAERQSAPAGLKASELKAADLASRSHGPYKDRPMIAARWLTAEEMGREYDSVSWHHGQFRRSRRV